MRQKGPAQRRQPWCILLLSLALATMASAAPGLSGPSASAGSRPGSAPDIDVPILMYHYLTGADTPPTDYHLTAGLFARQLDALIAYGYDFVCLQDFMAYRDGSAIPPDRPLIVTFDDGHESVYTLAEPILNSRSLNTTLFVATGFLGGAIGEGDYQWMTWNQIEALCAEGYPIESHSVSHPNLVQIPVEEAWHEVLDSRLEIEERLGSLVRFFAYPGGHGAYDPVIRALVQDAGYLAAVAAWPNGIANPATSDLWALPRVGITEQHSVDLDPEQPWNFFMRQVDPAFPLPLIAVDSIRLQHQDGTTGRCVQPGEALTLEIRATNHGDAATVQVGFSLDDDAEHGSVYYSQVTSLPMPSGETTTLFHNVVLGHELNRGFHSYSLDFLDPYAVLGFSRSGWRPAFLVAEACYTQALPAVFH